jgi:hypothetical protein
LTKNCAAVGAGEIVQTICLFISIDDRGALQRLPYAKQIHPPARFEVTWISASPIGIRQFAATVDKEKHHVVAH